MVDGRGEDRDGTELDLYLVRDYVIPYFSHYCDAAQHCFVRLSDLCRLWIFAVLALRPNHGDVQHVALSAKAEGWLLTDS